MEDVRKAVKKLKGGKSPGVDEITNEMLKCGGECLFEWLMLRITSKTLFYP